ncbi:MAG: adenine nucleotide alpha hydrolase [Candidatus Omnitrophica bacterium]|nr:adenine nucleotide alpha hydrolase [Candidatus Omnitrophota bacterium]
MKKALMAWSGGKDSALALDEIKKSGEYQIEALLTTVTREYERISMHGVPVALLRRQVESLGYPLEIVWISKDASNEDYESQMALKLKESIQKGVQAVIFGDIFLRDLRRYREENLAKVGLEAVFPLWQKKTSLLSKQFVERGFQAVVTCVDSQVCPGEFSGREYNAALLASLPSKVDPCGENGEFHSFVYAGPIFRDPIQFKKGEIVLRENRFSFCDLQP